MSNNRSTPVFIVGHPRSGSTLLASLMGSHENIFAVPETHFWDGAERLGLLFKLNIKHWPKKHIIERMYEVNPRLNDLPITQSDWQSEVKQGDPSNLCSVFKSLMRAIETYGDSRPLEKTPRHLEYVESIFNCFPDTKIICILRDGRDAVESLVKAEWTHSNQMKHAVYWSWCVRHAIKLKVKYLNNFYIVRYEDLLEEPESTLQMLCDFLGEPYDSSLLCSSSSSIVVPSWESNWKEKSQGAIDPSHAYKWKSLPLHNVLEIEDIICDELKLLNYPMAIATEHYVSHGDMIMKVKRATYSTQFHILKLLRSFGVVRKNAFRTRQID